MFYNIKKLFRQSGQNVMLTPSEKAFASRRIYFFEQLTSASAAQLIAMLHSLDSENSDEIYLYINSSDGSWDAALAVYDVINNLDSDVWTVCCGRVCDGAALVASAGKKGRRYILPNAEIVINRIADTAFGAASSVEGRTEQLSNLRQKVCGILAVRTRQSMDEISTDIQRDMVMTDTEALRYGICDVSGEPFLYA